MTYRWLLRVLPLLTRLCVILPVLVVGLPHKGACFRDPFVQPRLFAEVLKLAPRIEHCSWMSDECYQISSVIRTHSNTVRRRFITLVIIMVDASFSQADCNANGGVEGGVEGAGGELLVDEVHCRDDIGKTGRVLALAREELSSIIEDLVEEGNEDANCIAGR